MSTGIIVLIIVIILLLMVLVWYFSTYNALVKLRNRKDDQFAQIDVQLKMRFDLIPNLVETVKGYAKHETETFEKVVQARNTYNTAETHEGKIQAAGEMTQALNRLFALAEDYPELKSNENFMSLQSDLKEIEEKVRISRQFYNDTVLTYNNKVESIPSNIVASIAGFKKEEFFKIDDTEKANPTVKF